MGKDLVTCLECGHQYRFIGAKHLKYKHGMTSAEYRAKWGEDAPLTSQRTRERVSAGNRRYQQESGQLAAVNQSREGQPRDRVWVENQAASNRANKTKKTMDPWWLQTPEARRKNAAAKKGWDPSEETRRRMSESAVRRAIRTADDHSHPYRFDSEKCGRAFWVRSTYEVRAMEILESDPLVVGWDYEAVRVPYEDERGRRRNAAPDLLVDRVDGTTCLLEVKSLYFFERDWPKVGACQRFAFRRGWDFQLWMEPELGLAS